jgi:Xaa-Pro aminopeptidase
MPKLCRYPDDLSIDDLVPEKVEQAISILQEERVDAWLTFTQETMDGGDPVYPILFGERDLGRGALLLTRQGDCVAVVGGLDAAIPPSTGVWERVIVHPGDLREPLLRLLDEIQPQQIAINYSLNNRKADGMSHGDFLRLQNILAGSVFAGRLVSAENVILKLRGRKSAGEIAIMKEAIRQTDEIFKELGQFLRAGVTGRQIFDFVQAETRQRGLQTSWSRDHCPVVTVGPAPFMGHTPPGDTPTRRGQTLQVDFGVKYNGLCSDFQRMWYFLDEGESAAPRELQHLFDTIYRGLDAIIESLRPGNPTWKAAEAARKIIIDAGYPEFRYTVGHQLGRAAHDGGSGLARRKQGDPEWCIEAGNVFTAEGLETRIEGRGWVSLEEDVLVTSSGPLVLTNRQAGFWYVDK